jgi:hypothetical protein
VNHTPFVPGTPATGTAVTSPAGTAQASFTITIPASVAHATNVRRPAYVSAGANGLAIRAVASPGAITAVAWQTVDISSGSSFCSTAAGVRTCTVTASAPISPVGGDEVQIALYSAVPTNATTSAGLPLGEADVTGVTILQGHVNNAPAIALSGIVDGFTVNGRFSVWAAPGSNTTLNVPFTATDAAADTIFGTTPAYAAAIDVSGIAAPYSIASTSITAPPATATHLTLPITYAAPTTGSPPASTTITLTTAALPTFLSPTLASLPTQTFAITPLVVSATTEALTVGTPGSITATETGQTAAYTLASDTTSVATVPATSAVPTSGSATFAITPVGMGTAHVTVTDSLGTVATITVTVTAAGGGFAAGDMSGSTIPNFNTANYFPQQMTVTGSGATAAVYVLGSVGGGTANGNVNKVTAPTGTPIWAAPVSETNFGTSSGTQGIGVDSSGNILVADAGFIVKGSSELVSTGTVQGLWSVGNTVYYISSSPPFSPSTPTPTTLTLFSESFANLIAGSPPTMITSVPFTTGSDRFWSGFAVDASQTHAYIGYLNSTFTGTTLDVLQVTLAGGATSLLHFSVNGAIGGLPSPLTLAPDPTNGNTLYAVDADQNSGNQVVLKLSVSAQTSTQTATSTTFPAAVAVDTNGVLYVADTNLTTGVNTVFVDLTP